ncbi:MAG: phosphoenolpyruvate--protein phosphotransferase [Paenibacillaceae bacterium]
MELFGIAASNGYAMGFALVLRPEANMSKIMIDSKGIGLELERFEAAFRQTEAELVHVWNRLQTTLRAAEAEMVEALLELLRDDEYYLRIRYKIAEDHLQAETAVHETTDDIVARVGGMNNLYLTERSAEIRDVSIRLMNKLSGKVEWVMQEGINQRILITDELTTSYSAQLDPNIIIGCATERGGKTTHSAIIARSIGLPYVVGLGEQLKLVQDGQFIIVDGVEGKLIVEPDEAQVLFYTDLIAANIAVGEGSLASNPNTFTIDAHPIDLLANISSIACAREAKSKGAAGVGLFRTEFLFLNRLIPPSEDEQFEVYREVAEIFGKAAPIIIRTLDIGGDKQTLFRIHPAELNLMLGYRGIRVCLDQVELFKTQLCAILRASVYGHLKIMFPMIAILSEWREARAIVEEVKAALTLEGVGYNPTLEIGMMIEVPSAALNADQFAREADFFSIGTNDLIQYLMAVDRGNAELAYLYNGYEPTVLRLIQEVIQCAHKHNKWVSLCGDMAGQPMAAALLMGMGLQKLSMNASELAEVRGKIAEVKQVRMKENAIQILKFSEAIEVTAYLEKNG